MSAFNNDFFFKKSLIKNAQNVFQNKILIRLYVVFSDNSGVSSIGNVSGDHIAFRLGGAPGGGHRSSGGYHPRNMSCDSIMSTGSTGSMDSTYAGGATSHKKVGYI